MTDFFTSQHACLLYIDFVAGVDGGNLVFLSVDVLFIKCEGGGDFDNAVGFAFGSARNDDSGGFKPAGCAFYDHFFCGLGAINSRSVFGRGEFLAADGFENY